MAAQQPQSDDPVDAASLEHIVIAARIVGSLEDWLMDYRWDGRRHATRQEAIDAGIDELGHDDFLIGGVVGERLVWLGWQFEEREHDPEEFADVAAQLHLAADHRGHIKARQRQASRTRTAPTTSTDL